MLELVFVLLAGIWGSCAKQGDARQGARSTAGQGEEQVPHEPAGQQQLDGQLQVPADKRFELRTAATSW